MGSGIPTEDVSELRARLLGWMGEHGLTYADAASRCRLRPHQVRDFLGSRGCVSEAVVAALCRLPLGLSYQGPRILPRL